MRCTRDVPHTMAGRAWIETLAEHPALRSAVDTPPPADQRVARVAVRGTDLIAVVDNELRIVSLSGAKRGQDAYKVLRSPELNFRVQSVLVNATGKLLAAVGTHQVAIMVLPRRGYEKRVGSHIDVTVVPVGAFYHAPQGSTPIAQCVWHALGENSASLLVLTADGVVREYDVTHNVDEPQQTVVCVPQSPKRGGFSAEDDDSMIAQSLAVGADCATDDWLSLSLFVLMRNGDVWALCPFLPKHAVVSVRAVHALAARESSDPGKGGAPLRYVGALLRQIDTGDQARVTSPHIVAMPPRPQGPLLYKPEPVELDEENAPLASDLLLTWIGGQDAPRIPVMCIANCDGRVDVCFLPDLMAPAWEERVPPTLAVYESIDLGATDHEYPVFLYADPLYPDVFVATSRHGVYTVSFQDWSEPLVKGVVAVDRSLLRDAMAQGTRSRVTREVEAKGPAVVGVAVISDVYLSYALLALTSDGQLVVKEPELRVTEENEPTEPEIKGDEPAYRSLIGSGLAIPDTLKRTKAAPQVSAPIDGTPGALRTFGTAAAHYQTQIGEVVQAGNAVQAHLDLQLHELARQLDKLAAIESSADSFNASAPIAERLERVSEAQAATVQRIDSLLQRLMDKHQPQLSVYEHRWFDELQRMAREFGVADAGARYVALERLRRVRANANQLEHQFSVLRPSIDSWRNTTQHARERLGSKQLERVERQLVHEAAVLSLARAKAQYLQAALRTS